MTSAATNIANHDPTGRSSLANNSPDPNEILARVLGPAFIRYRREWDRAGLMTTPPPFPLHLDVDTNYSCNLACVICPQGAPGFPISYPDTQIPWAWYERALAEGTGMGLASVRLGITGEPLLRPDIVDFVRLARDMGLVDIMLITNGTLLRPALGRSLIEAGLTRLQVSLDAARPETYRLIRRRGDLERVRANVLGFLALRREMGRELPLVRVSFVRLTLNQGQDEEFARYWQGRADYVSFQDYANILGRAETRFHRQTERKLDGFRCPDPWQRLSLFANGDLFPCCADFGRLAPLGRIEPDGLTRVWTSPAAERLRDIHRRSAWVEEPVCRRCLMALGWEPGP